MEYVKMQQHHVGAVADLEKLCFPDPWPVEAFVPELLNPLSLWLVAVENGVVVGYAGSQSVPPEADIMNVAVHPSYRRCGIAHRLLERLQATLAERGVTSLSLEVRVSNAPAIALYKSMGFRQVGLRKNYYKTPKEDALILRKEWEI